MEKIEKFLKKLQESDEKIKKIATAIGTAIVMIVIVLVWFRFFNPVTQSNVTTPPEQNQTSFFDTLKSGFKIVGGKIGDKIKNVSRSLGSSRQYIIINHSQK